MMSSCFTPDYLKPGDKIAIVAPARSITEKETVNFKTWASNQGWIVIESPNLYGCYHQFSGTVDDRIQDLKWAYENDDIKAIFAARGGYGCLQLLEKLKTMNISKNPKWLIGFSDISTLHFYCQSIGISSIHGPMVAQFNQKHNFIEKNNLSLLRVLTGKEQIIDINSQDDNLVQKFEGQLFGGNLSLLYSFAASGGRIPYKNSVLFIEDLDEYLYHIDRMIVAMKYGGFFDSISALIVGSFTQMNDNSMPFGFDVKEIIRSNFKSLNIPILFDFPSGHSDENYSLKLGLYCTFESHKFTQF